MGHDASTPPSDCANRETEYAMDPAALLQNIYRCYREKRLADIVELLSDDFKFRAQLPEDGDGDCRPRSRAEVALMVHKFMDQYDME